MDYFHMAAFSNGMNSNGYNNPNRSAMREHLNKLRNEAYIKAVGSESFPRVYSESDLNRYIKREKDRKRWDSRLEKMGMTEAQVIAKVKKGIQAVERTQKYYNGIRGAENELYRQIRYISTEEQDRPLKLPHDYQYDDAKPLEVVSASTMFGENIDLGKHRRQHYRRLRRLDDQ